MFDESASKEYVVSTSEEVSTSDLLDIYPVRHDFDGLTRGGDSGEAVGSDG
nr:hypothetical protein [Haloquadratum walsbyi]